MNFDDLRHSFAGRSIVTLVALALLLLGCGGEGEESDQVFEQDVEAAQELAEETDAIIGEASAARIARLLPDTLYLAPLEAEEGSAATLDGVIAIVTTGPVAPLRLVVHARGLPSGPHAWHIHQGPCSSSGDVVLALPATADSDGHAGPIFVPDNGVVDLAVAVPELQATMVGAREHSVHIHADAGEDHGPTIACATI